MAQSADRGGRSKRHRDDDEEDGVSNNLHGKRRVVGNRRSDSASTWRKRQRRGSLNSSSRYNSQGGYDTSTDLGPVGGGSIESQPQEVRKDLNRPPPPLIEDEGGADSSKSWSNFYGPRGAMYVAPQQQSPQQSRQASGPSRNMYGQQSSRDPSPVKREFPPQIVQSSPGRGGDMYAMTALPPQSRPNRPTIDESARALHPSKSAVMNAIATIGLPFLQYELSATEARFPPMEEGHLFAALALHVSMRNAGRKARARSVLSESTKDVSMGSEGDGGTDLSHEHHHDQGKVGGASGLSNKLPVCCFMNVLLAQYINAATKHTSPSQGMSTLRRLALKKKPLSDRREYILERLSVAPQRSPKCLISHCSTEQEKGEDQSPTIL